MDDHAETGAMSDKRRKFRRLAESRTSKALEAIERVGNLSNRQLYEWDDAEIAKIVQALNDAVAEVESRFASPNARPTTRFKL